MAHKISPNSLRLGKTYLWNNNFILLKNSLNINKNSTSTAGINSILNSIFKKKKYFIIKTNIISNNITGCPTIKILYYPFFYYSMRAFKTKIINMAYPRLSDLKKLFLNQIIKPINKKHKRVLKKIWKSRKRVFLNRFVSSREYLWYTQYLFRAFLKGSKWKNYFAHQKYFYIKKNIKARNYLLTTKTNKKSSSFSINANIIANILSKKLGYRINVKALNIFDYLSLKLKKFNIYKYKEIFFREYFFFYRRTNKYFLDFVNLFVLMCYFPNISFIITKLIQNSLEKMHKQKIKPKYFFYFLDHLIKKIPLLRLKFSSIKLIITGKLKGGTARTRSHIIGFGSLPIQTLSSNIFYNFTNVESKYGSFGVKFWAYKK